MSYGLRIFEGSSRARSCLYAIATFAVLVAWAFSPPAASATTKIPTEFNLFGTPRVKPSQIQVGNVSQLQSLRWKKWGRSVSTARGYFYMCDASSGYSDLELPRFKGHQRQEDLTFS